LGGGREGAGREEILARNAFEIACDALLRLRRLHFGVLFVFLLRLRRVSIFLNTFRGGENMVKFFPFFGCFVCLLFIYLIFLGVGRGKGEGGRGLVCVRVCSRNGTDRHTMVLSCSK